MLGHLTSLVLFIWMRPRKNRITAASVCSHHSVVTTLSDYTSQVIVSRHCRLLYHRVHAKTRLACYEGKAADVVENAKNITILYAKVSKISQTHYLFTVT